MRHISAGRPGAKVRTADHMPFYDNEIGAAASDLLSQSAASIYYQRIEENWISDVIKSGNLIPLGWKLLDY